MSAADPRKVESIFVTVAAMEPAQRRDALDRLCDGCMDLRQEVESLLHFHDATGVGALDQPPLMALGLSTSRAVEAEDHALPPNPTAAGYTLTGVVGGGGMGVVYMAEQHRPRRTVAVKVIRRSASQSELLRRFEHEAEALARLQHPGIAQIFEAGVADFGHGPQPFIAMELVRGVDLVRAAREGQYPVRRRLEVMASVCDAVQHAHQRGVIHRDLKPANILVVYDEQVQNEARRDADASAPASEVSAHSRHPVSGTSAAAQPKILDFGVARVTDADVHATLMHTGIGQLIGTLPYMSPEQVQGDPREIDTRSDVYSLGVILYELLADRLPHDVSSRSIPEAARVIREESPTRLSAISPLFRGDIDTIVCKALEKDPARRYQSAAELGADLRRCLNDEPIVARRASALYQLRKFAERNKRLVATVAIGLMLLLGTTVVSTIFGLQATGARRLAESAQSDAEARGRAAAAEAGKARWAAYLANIAAAQSSLRANDLFAARRRLDAADPPRKDTFEWKHLYARLDDSVALLTGPGRFLTTALSPNGRMLASGGSRGQVFVWSVELQQVYLSLAHEAVITAIGFTPDSAAVAAADADGLIRFWDARTGSLLRVLEVKSATARSLTFSADGHRMLVVSPDEPLQVWDIHAEQLLYESAADEQPTAAALSPDGRWLAVAHRDRTVRVLDMAHPADATMSLSHPTVVHDLSFDAAGMRLLAGGSDHALYISEIPGGRLVRVIKGHTDAVIYGRFSESGLEVCSASHDGTLRLWSAETGEEIGALRGPGGSIARAAADDDLRIVATVSQDQQVRLWDLEVARHGGAINSGSRNLLTALAFSPDSRRFASGSGDGMVRLWEADSATLIAEFPGHTDVVQALAFSPDGRRLISGSFDHTARVWDMSTGTLEGVLAEHGGSVFGVAFAPDGQGIATASGDGIIRLWDAHTLKLRTAIEGHRGEARSVAFSPDGKMLASCGADAMVRLWDARTGSPQGVLRGHRAPAQMVAFNSAGTLLASTSDDRTARLWEVESRTPFGPPLAHAEGVTGCAFSPDGSRLATGCGDAAVHLWDVAGGEEVLVLRQHRYAVVCVSFAPNGSRLISGSLDRWLQIWETTPLADRATARSRQASLASQAAAIVDTAMAQHRDASLAADGLRGDRSLGEELRAAALDELLRRGARKTAATASPSATRPG